jgi:hypothetical protein
MSRFILPAAMIAAPTLIGWRSAEALDSTMLGVMTALVVLLIGVSFYTSVHQTR